MPFSAAADQLPEAVCLVKFRTFSCGEHNATIAAKAHIGAYALGGKATHSEKRFVPEFSEGVTVRSSTRAYSTTSANPSPALPVLRSADLVHSGSNILSRSRCVNAILIKELIELLAERMVGRWRDLFGSDEKQFRSRFAFGQSHAESSSANVAGENSVRRKTLQRTANPPANTGEGTRQ